MEEKIEFKNSKVQKLIGILNIPPGKGPFDAVVFAHGRGSGKGAKKAVVIEKRLKNKIFFRFDFTGCGESEEKYEDTTPTKLLDDLTSAIKFLRSLKSVKDVHLIGSSLGGFVSLLYASKDPKLKSLVLICPLSDFSFHYKTDKRYSIDSWKKIGYVPTDTKLGKQRLKYRYYQDGIKYNGFNLAKKIKSPTLIIHGDADKMVPLKECKKLFSNLKCEKSLEIVKGAGHFFERPREFENVVKSSCNWINSHSK